MIKTSYFSRTSAQIIVGWAKTDEEKKSLQKLRMITHCDGYRQGVFSHMELRIAEPIIKGLIERGERRTEMDIPYEWEITMLRELNIALKCDEEYYGPVTRLWLAISRYLRQKVWGDGIEVWKEVKDYP